MLEEILKENLVEKRPEYALALGILFSTIGLAVSVLMFKESPSFPAVFLTTLAAAPIAMKLRPTKGDFVRKYEHMIKVYAYLFFGMAISFAIWFAILPSAFTEVLFKEQLLKFTVGYFSFGTANFVSIVLNNIGLLLFFFLLSLFYGSGSMFLLSWNASILGVMWGNTVKSALAIFNPSLFIVNTIKAFPYLFPEVIAYFLAAIAGLMLSINFAQKGKFNRTYKDSMMVLLVALVLIVIAGFVETIILGL